jgi:hypothetical protein
MLAPATERAKPQALRMRSAQSSVASQQRAGGVALDKVIPAAQPLLNKPPCACIRKPSARAFRGSRDSSAPLATKASQLLIT